MAKLSEIVNPKQCKVHPRYRGIHKPRSVCITCCAIYLNKHPKEKFPNFISGKLMCLDDYRRAGQAAGERLVRAFPRAVD